MSLGGFGSDAERSAQNPADAQMEQYCPSCISKDAEIARLSQARDTALEALERERCARWGTA